MKDEPGPLHLTGKWLILSDVHLPYQDNAALTLALNHGVASGCQGVVLNGDIVDFYQLSRFSRDPSQFGVRDEIECWRAFAETLRELWPEKGALIYKRGNHEMRLESYLAAHAPELYDLADLSFQSLMGFEDLGIVQAGVRPIKAGALNILHGHEFGESIFSPVNPARGAFLRTKASTVIGHHHQPSHHSENTLDGNPTGCWSTGCLCQLNPDYRPFAYTKWAHGFAEVESEQNGGFELRNYRIIDGKVRPA